MWPLWSTKTKIQYSNITKFNTVCIKCWISSYLINYPKNTIILISQILWNIEKPKKFVFSIN